jgi:RNA polymerase sigma-70 factor (ECF subfamily)
LSSNFGKRREAPPGGGAGAGSAAGMEAYLAEMIRLYGGLVRHICRNALGNNEADVDECVSDVFVALWQKVSGGADLPGAARNADGADSAGAAHGADGEAGQSAIKSYICGIARHKAIDRYRKLTARPATVSISDAYDGGAALGETLSEPDVAELFARGHDEAVIAKAVDGLPPTDREIFILRYYYMERVKSIADKLGMTEKAVENRLYRGKLSLRQTLSDCGITKNNCEVLIYE